MKRNKRLLKEAKATLKDHLDSEFVAGCGGLVLPCYSIQIVKDLAANLYINTGKDYEAYLRTFALNYQRSCNASKWIVYSDIEMPCISDEGLKVAFCNETLKIKGVTYSDGVLTSMAMCDNYVLVIKDDKFFIQTVVIHYLDEEKILSTFELSEMKEDNSIVSSCLFGTTDGITNGDILTDAFHDYGDAIQSFMWNEMNKMKMVSK